MKRFIRYLLGVGLLAVMGPLHAAPPLSPRIEPLDIDRIGPITARLATHAAEHRIQVLISEVKPNRADSPQLRSLGYRVDAEYFYPASSIKLCAAIGALGFIERLAEERGCQDLLSVPFSIDDPADTTVPKSALNDDRGTISTLALELRKLALVSDNDAFNHLFDLVGPDELNRRMHQLGLTSVVINHRLAQVRSSLAPRTTRPVTLRPPDAAEIRLPSLLSTLDLTNHARRLCVGDAYLRGGERVPTPMDFSRRNGISLRDLHRTLILLARPDLERRNGCQVLAMTPNHRRFLLDAMSWYPRESVNPKYNAADYPDHYGKFLLPGIRRVFPDREPGTRIEVANKIGRAYGFSIENAWVRNPANGREVFVTAVVYTNEDGVLNDDRYEYETVADPFFEELGEWVARRFLSSR